MIPMNKRLLRLVLAAVCAVVPALPVGAEFYDAVRLETGQVMDRERFRAALSSARLVLVGEHHNNRFHHGAQLEVIRMLHRSGRQVVVGLEMFRHDSQDLLDRYINGRMDEADFLPVYLDNWNYAWPLYRPLFHYAREHRLPMVGLNVSRKLTRQVARLGFDSLSEAQKGQLHNISCDISGDYREYVRRAFGGHGSGHAHGGLQFEYFCQAQLVWDSVMAIRAGDYLKAHPEAVMVIIAGAAHARKPGIPAQFKKQSTLPVLVLLPEAVGSMDTSTISFSDADFLLLQP